MIFRPSLGVYYWQHETPNFGDELAPLVLEHFTDAKVHWASPSSSDIVVTGSVLDVLPKGWSGIVAGAGFLCEDSFLCRGVDAKILGVRGPLTAWMLGIDDTPVILGDPALLVSEMVETVPGQYGIGVVPHCTDDKLYAREFDKSAKYGYQKPILIDTGGDPLDVVGLIGSCERIVSSSLHGLIVADSFGIPRRAEKFASMETNPYEGGEFKFRDYGESIGQPIEWGTLQSPPKDKIEAMQSDLFDMFQELNEMINE